MHYLWQENATQQQHVASCIEEQHTLKVIKTKQKQEDPNIHVSCTPPAVYGNIFN